ncbi:MAG: hypothetical protein CMJ89_06350 [Planctomycetes bacterium]|jgi:diguanylate cyclase (GGDEF)-like protein|nr:hypothetical protein [Planctomycetota bacterium]
MTTPPQRILVCDHRGAGIETRFEALREGLEVRITRSLRESVESIAKEDPHLVVLDPLTRGAAAELAALTGTRRDDGTDACPFLIIWDRDNSLLPRRLEEGLGPHPWDLVHRDATVQEFTVRLGQLLGYGRMQKEMEELRHRAVHDDRTELLRPLAFQERLSEHFAAAKRHKQELCFVLMDLDKFGQINKIYDHTVGDRLITRVGEVIRKSLRTEDVAGRLGGDEFAVVLPYTAKVAAVAVVNRLRERIAALTGPHEGTAASIQISTSIGFETYNGTDVDSLEAIRDNAEMALRKAKELGGDRAVYYRSLNRGSEEKG